MSENLTAKFAARPSMTATMAEGVPVPGPAGASLGIQDEGAAVPAQPALNFTGAGVSVADDSANSRTNVTIAADYAPATPSINAQTGTSYTLVASDNGKIVTMSNAAAITLTVPSGLGAGFNCLIVQLAAGKITPTASSATLVQRQSFTKTAGQYAVMSLVAYVANTFVMSGDMST